MEPLPHSGGRPRALTQFDEHFLWLIFAGRPHLSQRAARRMLVQFMHKRVSAATLCRTVHMRLGLSLKMPHAVAFAANAEAQLLDRYRWERWWNVTPYFVQRDDGRWEETTDKRAVLELVSFDECSFHWAEAVRFLFCPVGLRCNVQVHTHKCRAVHFVMAVSEGGVLLRKAFVPATVRGGASRTRGMTAAYVCEVVRDFVRDAQSKRTGWGNRRCVVIQMDNAPWHSPRRLAAVLEEAEQRRVRLSALKKVLEGRGLRAAASQLRILPRVCVLMQPVRALCVTVCRRLTVLARRLTPLS